MSEVENFSIFCGKSIIQLSCKLRFFFNVVWDEVTKSLFMLSFLFVVQFEFKRWSFHYQMSIKYSPPSRMEFFFVFHCESRWFWLVQLIGFSHSRFWFSRIPLTPLPFMMNFLSEILTYEWKRYFQTGIHILNRALICHISRDLCSLIFGQMKL